MEIKVNGKNHPAYKSDVSPAQAVVLAALILAERPIDLCVSGINFGENIGSTVTTSGTVGAAMEAASFDMPALAMSLETPKEFHVKYSDEIDFDAAAHFTGIFAQRLLNGGLPPGVDLLKIDVPATATTNTDWQAGTVARQRYWHPTLNQPARPNEQQSIGYQARVDYHRLEPESDIHIFLVDRLVSVVPMTLDLTAPVDLTVVTNFLNGSS
jgi:5'-nucleotidase